MKTNKILEIALAKAKHFHGRVWCGAFTPVEILALVEDGARPEHSEHWPFQKQLLEDKIRKGISYQTWFYFQHNSLTKEVEHD